MDDNDRTGPRFCILFSISILLGSAAFAHAFMTRTLGLVLVDIVNDTTATNSNSNESDACSSYGNSYVSKCNFQRELLFSNDSLTLHGNFKWDTEAQGNIIAIHDWLELVFLPFSGILVSLWNPGIQMGFMSLIAAGATAALPVLAIQADYGGVMISRAILGSCHAITSPATDAVVARTIPMAVRSTVYAVITSGSQIAVFVGLPLTAYFINHNLFGGWEATFYLSSIICFIWSIVWLIFQMFVLKDSSPLAGRPKATCHVFSKQHLKALWNDVFSHRYVWALFPCDIAATFTIRLLTYYIPRFYKSVFHVQLLNNAFFSALPFISILVAKFVFCASADILKHKFGWSSNIVAKCFNSFAFIGSGLCILLVTLIPTTSSAVVVALITTGAGIYSANTPGYRLSYTSISKRWAGVVSASCSCVAMVAGIVFPYFVGAVVRDGTEKRWQIVFALIFACDVAAAVLFALFGSVMNMDKVLSDEGSHENTTGSRERLCAEVDE